MANALIVVAKEPVAGTTKTRLCPPFEVEEAAEFYRCLLIDTLQLMSRLQSVDRIVAYTPTDARPYFEALVPAGFRLVPQRGANLGERLTHALGQQFDAGYRRVAIMNSDGPTLPLACLEEAFACLEEADVTLGPGHDGGYYLIGMRQPHPALFEGIDWSTDRVLAQTLAASKRLSLAVHQLPTWYDIDVAPDLARLHADLVTSPHKAPATWAFLQNNGHARAVAANATEHTPDH